MLSDELCSSILVRSRAALLAKSDTPATLQLKAQRFHEGKSAQPRFQYRSRQRCSSPHSTQAASSIVCFHLVPPRGWDDSVKAWQCLARNTLKKKGDEWVPEGKPYSSWLIPASDEVAVQIAQQHVRLRALGWKLLTSEPHVVLRLGNKATFRNHAEKLGLLAHLPVHYVSPEAACFPCILKVANGDWGRDVHIVNGRDDVHRIAGIGLGSQWLLQELVEGRFEYAVSLLVNRGHILSSIGTVYEYDKEVYVWPHVRAVKTNFHCPSEQELAVMSSFLDDYSGICNFNYKIRECGGLSIFEINTRVGGDLACDAPAEKVREMLELLDTLSTCQSGLQRQPDLKGGAWDAPLVIEPTGGIHRYTLVYLHPFRIGLRDYIRKMGLFSVEGLRIIMPNAPQRSITCFGHRPMKSWYDYLTDHQGHAEDEVCEITLAETRQYISNILDEERARIREAAENYDLRGDGGDRVLIGGCSQGCGVALDVALRYPVRLLAFVGVVGHPLSVTPLGCHLDMPVHFFLGAKDKVMRWHWVKDLIDGLEKAGYNKVNLHGPFPSVHHGVGREFEAECVHTVLRNCTGEYDSIAGCQSI